jgi:UDP-N-acetylmuramoyl-tripeptide--D-alanyl-D-alanine ligase
MRRTTFVVITGSVGKTTAKEGIAAMLGSLGPTLKTRKNENTFGGVARSVLRVRPRHRFAVVEVGSHMPGIIHHWAGVLRPDVAVVLRVADVHGLSYNSLDEIAEEKGELLHGLRDKGVAILNGDDPRVAALGKGRPFQVLRFGTSPQFDVWADQVSARWPDRLSFIAHAGDESVPVRTQLVGEYWLPSILAALTVAHHFGVDLQRAAEVIGSVPPNPARLQPVDLPMGATVLRDEYNSAPATFESALGVLKQARAKRRIVVTNGITESKENSRKRMVQLGKVVADSADAAVFFGQFNREAKSAAIAAGMEASDVHRFKTLREAADFLKGELRPGDLLLLKGRHSHHLSRILFAQVADVKCWIPSCHKRTLCEECPELGPSRDSLAQLIPSTAFDQGEVTTRKSS